MKKEIKEEIKTIKIGGYGQIERLTLNEKFFKKEGRDLKFGKLVKIRPFENSIGGTVMKSFFGMFSEKPRNDLQGYMAEYEKGFLVVESDGEYIDMMIIKK